MEKRPKGTAFCKDIEDICTTDETQLGTQSSIFRMNAESRIDSVNKATFEEQKVRNEEMISELQIENNELIRNLMMYDDQSIIGQEKIKQNKKRIKEVRESKSKTDEMISYVMPEYQKLLSENKRLKSDIDDLHNRSNSQQKTVKLMKIEEEQLAQGIQGATKEIQILKDKIDSKRKKITDFTDKKLKILDNIIMTKKRLAKNKHKFEDELENMQKKFSLLSIKNEQIKEYNLLLECYLCKGKIEDSNKQLNEGLVWNKKINIKLNCGHFFHSLCLSDYIKLEKYECPICKTNINQDLEEIKQKTKDILKSSFSRRNSH